MDLGMVFEPGLQAQAETLMDADPRIYAKQMRKLRDYHIRLSELMEAELGGDPGEAQQAVYDAQAKKVKEMERFKEAARIGTRSTAI